MYNHNVNIQILIIFLATTKIKGLQSDNFCKANVEKISMKNEKMIKYNETVWKCCDGYVTVKDKCKPYCASCSIEECIGPNVCQCKKGFLWNTTSQNCEFQCDCSNGYCPKADQCVCLSGYKKPWEAAHFCEPFCEPECPQFSTCVEPKNCVCYKGYEKNSLNGECELECNEETERPDFEINECVMKNCICSNGGYCLENYSNCICYQGYHRTKDHQCVPHCEHPCENADCTAPNHCDCWDGYHVTSNPYVCESNHLCQQKPCENGECLFTGECKCKRGFTKSFTFNGQIVCETMTVFIGKTMTVILGIPVILAAVVLFIFYIVALRNKKNENEKLNQFAVLLYGKT
ncbi:uncharacterized protein LOC142227545 [Haematobia irritans]|uniref:uncharacterized protein LOC142227545 n=1 Tax=Haematobia irritans TaxID=7368 RepID=UPI003F502854